MQLMRAGVSPDLVVLPHKIAKRFERFERIAEFCRRKRVFQRMLPLVAAAMIVVSVPSSNIEKGIVRQTENAAAQISSTAASGNARKALGWAFALGPVALIGIMAGAILKDRSKERKDAFDAPSSETGIEGEDIGALFGNRHRYF